MRYSKSLIRTLREAPAGCDVPSQILMYRTGMVKQESSGLYTYLPYFNLILQKVADTIRAEMNRLDAQECKFPILVSQDLLEKSGRWTAFGDEMFSLKDRHQNGYALSPTNEEAAAMTAKQYVTSFRDLPLTVYQINTKHRDEIRPRGIGRTRAFTMKDAYSFHTTEESLDETYQAMVKGYVRIFKNLGLTAFPVFADNGTMGGTGSQEVMAISNEGDDFVARCPHCGYAANLEVVPCVDPGTVLSGRQGMAEKKHTPEVGTIEELVAFFHTDAAHFAKSMVYVTDSGELVVAVVRGDRDVNEVKLRNIVKAKSVELCNPADIESLGSYVGFVGPVGLKTGTKIVVDNEVKAMTDFIVGANERDYHLIHVNCRDFDPCTFGDLRMAVAGDAHSCGGTFEVVRAAELGHCFKLGDRYTQKLEVTYTDTDNTQKVMTMGCYGIGLERVVSAIIDQYHDKDGIAWPMPVAPIQVDVIPTGKTVPPIAEEIYQGLLAAGMEVLLDDRDARPGVKFKDADLLGIPVKVIIGKRYESEGAVEVKLSLKEKDQEERVTATTMVESSAVVETVREMIARETERFYAKD